MNIKPRVALTSIFFLITLPAIANAQTTKPGLKKPASRTSVAPLVPIGTNLKVRLNETLSSKE